jgi:hypothetical protein
MIIAIPKKTYEKYTRISNEQDTGIEEVLTVTKPFYGDNDELIYTISPKHILGYYNNKTSEFVKNRIWDQNHDSSYAKTFRRRMSGNDREF